VRKKLKHIDHCIFDLDGVLVDTAKFHFIAWAEIANTLGFTLSSSLNESLKGIARKESLHKILDWAGKELDPREMDTLLEQKNTLYLSQIASLTTSALLPGSHETLEYLKGIKVKISLGSASKNAKFIIKQLQIENYFDCIIDGTMVTRPKPDPEVFLKACHRLGMPVFKTCVFEDSAAGIEAATAGGMYAIGICEADKLPQAYQNYSNLEEVNWSHLDADIIIRIPDPLVKIDLRS